MIKFNEIDRRRYYSSKFIAGRWEEGSCPRDFENVKITSNDRLKCVLFIMISSCSLSSTTLSYVKRDYDKPSNNPKSLEISYYPGKLRSTKQTWRANLISGPNPISPGQSMTSCFHLVPRHPKWLWTIIATL